MILELIKVALIISGTIETTTISSHAVHLTCVGNSKLYVKQNALLSALSARRCIAFDVPCILHC